MAKIRGFTLIELLVVISVMAILVALVVPSFGRMIQSNSVSSDVNTFLSDMRFARGEAVRRGTLVVMCASNNPETAPDCDGGVNWHKGWIVFEDRNNSGTYDSTAPAEPLLRQQGPISRSGGMIDGSGAATKFHFVATGRLRSVADATNITVSPASGSGDTTLQRIVCVSASGRARVAGDGSSSCS